MGELSVSRYIFIMPSILCEPYDMVQCCRFRCFVIELTCLQIVASFWSKVRAVQDRRLCVHASQLFGWLNFVLRLGRSPTSWRSIAADRYKQNKSQRRQNISAMIAICFRNLKSVQRGTLCDRRSVNSSHQVIELRASRV